MTDSQRMQQTPGMKLWFAVPLGFAMLRWPLVAEWFVLSSIALVVIFGGIAVVRDLKGGGRL